MEKFMLVHVDDAIAVVNKLKRFLNSQNVINVVSLIPEKYQRIAVTVRDRIAAILDVVALKILEGQDVLNLTPQQRLQKLIDYLKTLSPAMKEAAYMKVASLYANESSNNLLKSKLVDTAVQNQYVHQTTSGLRNV